GTRGIAVYGVGPGCALSLLFASVSLPVRAHFAGAEPLSLQPPRYFVEPAPPPAAAPPAPVRVAAARGGLGGGFIEAIFGGGDAAPRYATRGGYAAPDYARQSLDPRYLPQTVAYSGAEPAGTIVIDTPQHFLYLVEAGGTARRYGIGVGRPGFTWAGVKTISAKREWPDWRPPPEMLQRRPDLPTFMAGGPENPLGARAMYLGSS